MMRNEFERPCRVCGAVDDEPGGYPDLEPDGYDLEWVHDTCRDEPHPGTPCGQAG